MKYIVALVSFLSLALVTAFAANPEVSVTSAEPFRLRGAVVPVAGVPSWPVLVGDEIATDRAAALVRFGDGTTVTLRENSSARFENAGDRPIFRLLTGGMDVKPTAQSRVGFYSQNRVVAAPAGRLTTAIIKSNAAPRPPPPGPPPGPPHPPPASHR
jgi:hypothetical protein